MWGQRMSDTLLVNIEGGGEGVESETADWMPVPRIKKTGWSSARKNIPNNVSISPHHYYYDNRLPNSRIPGFVYNVDMADHWQQPRLVLLNSAFQR